MTLRPAEISDAAGIAEVLYHSFYSTFRTEKNEPELLAYLDTLKEDAILKMMNRTDTVFWVAEEDSELAGFAQLVVESPYPDDPQEFLKVERLYVGPDAQGRGIGRRLMAEAMRFGVEKGMKHIWLLVLRSNFDGLRFYENLGFERFDTSPGKFIADNEIDLWMRRELLDKERVST